MRVTVYKRNTVFTFFVAMLLVIPTIVQFLSLEFLYGLIGSVLIFILIGHHFGIKFNKVENEFIIYSGFKILHKVKKRIKLSDITGYDIEAKKVKSNYSLPVGSYDTSVKSYRLVIEINNKYKVTMLTGTKKAIDKIIGIIENQKM
jgi:hypothetical protein